MNESPTGEDPAEIRAPEPDEARRARRKRGHWLVGAAIALFAISALMMANAGYGSNPHRTFAQRRAYDTVRRDVRKALPKVLTVGLVGLLLLRAGARTLAGTAEPEE